MANLALMKELSKSTGGKIVLLVLDGLGGLPMDEHDLTTLEYAKTPVMDRLAEEGCQGLSHPISRGVTPGSGPAHLALFGYDPVTVPVGRGVLSALGIGFDLQADDVAARGNFATIDEDGVIIDRRAGRISSNLAIPLVEKLDSLTINGVETFARHVKEYRFTLVLRGTGLKGDLDDTDPQVTGRRPLKAAAQTQEAELTALLVQNWIDAAADILRNEEQANMVTLRGFGKDPDLPKFGDIYKLRSACVAVYPMYKGVSRLVGMDVLETSTDFSPADEFRVIGENWNSYDFFFVHIKPTDSRGEDGDYLEKAKVIESVDQALQGLLDLSPDVLIITGDHSTPARLRSHSWHPVPTLLWAPTSHLQDRAIRFGERESQSGGLGQFPASDIMPLAMAHALRLEKFGA